MDFGDEVVACRDIRKVKDWHALELGDEVKVKESEGCLSFVARITAINFETETYTVEYDGGEMEENVDEGAEENDDRKHANGEEGRELNRALGGGAKNGQITKRLL